MSFLTFIREKTGFVTTGAVTISEIENAEQVLGVKFSKEYAEYVQNCGAASFDYHELTGICSSKRLSVVEVTQKQRQITPNVPSDLYVVEECGMDGACMWQDEAGKVYCILPGNEPEEVASSLLEYVEE
jgi:hypothetical protein